MCVLEHVIKGIEQEEIEARCPPGARRSALVEFARTPSPALRLDLETRARAFSPRPLIHHSDRGVQYASLAMKGNERK